MCTFADIIKDKRQQKLNTNLACNVCVTACNKTQTSAQSRSEMNFLIQIFFKFALFTLYKELSHKGELIFLNESTTQQKLQKTEQ